jgi:hypothetical protein
VKPVLLTCFAAALWAGEIEDRAAIEKVIAALNQPAQRARLFTNDADCPVDFDRLIDLHKKYDPGLMIGMDETWTLLTVPRVVLRNIRFITMEVAMVDGASTIRGAVTLARSVPLLFVMKKEGGEWRISAVRVLTRRVTLTPASPSPAAP